MRRKSLEKEEEIFGGVLMNGFAMESDCWTDCSGLFSSACGEKLLLLLSIEL